ncbi:class I SAM-dependent methyltransferase [Chondromyces apiculatus]|uniref:Tetratricopeptide repeat domain protein n=1 Tax=Chondromyces apiculatus DSM 436 TaxID=1192034 RepID=A0A017TDI2_9BACT|nr:class I SAM-dependent methyltransferase [Chondromyces apiculatus]EYF06972.1 tetratricopeptide repeat domain protein [Chondromyces apiculatus DSM 436]
MDEELRLLEEIHDRYRAAGLDAAAAVKTPSPEEIFYLALLAFADDRAPEAAAFAARAAQAVPEDRLFQAAATYLARVVREGKRQVYVSAEGFAAFIRGGGNVQLYERTSAALSGQYPDAPFDLLDIGVGDGMALLPALTRAVRHVTLLEPATPMLERCAALLAAQNLPFATFAGSAQAFLAAPEMASRRWEVAQATYSLHAIPPADRPALLRWLRDHVGTLLVAEFDAPDMHDALEPRMVRHVLGRYRVGLGEYEGAEGEVVVQGFLMPVMFGYVDRGVTRATYEQPISDWASLLEDAGFSHVERHALYPYWWAPAVLLVAR